MGDIAEHLYLQRARNDGDTDIRAYSSRIRIENSSGREATYFIEKAENFAVPFALLVDGKPYPYEQSTGKIHLQLTLPAHSSRTMALQYKNQPLSSVGIDKDSLRIRAIRYLSDLRDDVVSRNRAGRWFIGSYSEHTGLWNAGIFAVAGILILVPAAWFVRRLKKGPTPATPALHSSVGSAVRS